MRLLLNAVGRARAGPEKALYAHYADRSPWPITLKEVEEKRRLPDDKRIAREGEMLLDATPADAPAVVLDETGRGLSSEKLADRLGRWRDEGATAVAFLIGGADGHAPAVRQRADLLLALGPMTWPHMLVRGMLAEQLYRAQMILQGHPYHRG